MSDIVPFSFVVPASAIPSCIGHCREAVLGSSVVWDWRHFHYELHSCDMRSWLASSGRSVLPKVVADWALPPDSLVRPTKGCAPDAAQGLGGRRHSLLVSTAAICALLLHQACLSCNPPERRGKCTRMASDWLGLSAKGFSFLKGHRIAIRLDLGDRDAELQVDTNSGTLLGMSALLGHAPGLAARWGARSPKLGGLASVVERPTVADLTLFVADVPQSIKARWPWLDRLAAGLLPIAALGIESFVMNSYIPEHGRLRAVEPLRARFRARNLDPVNRERLGAKMDSVGGSAAHTSRAVAGSAWHAAAWRQATLHLYDQKSKSTFKGCLHISLALDPGAYSGEQTNVGCIYSTDCGMSAALPIKVTSAP